MLDKDKFILLALSQLVRAHSKWLGNPTDFVEYHDAISHVLRLALSTPPTEADIQFVADEFIS